MKSIIKVLTTLFVLSSPFAVNAQEALIGTWNTGQANTRIEMKRESGDLKGRIVSSDNPQAKVGTLMVKDIRTVDGQWKGKLYSPKKEQWFDAVLKVEGNQLLITVKSGWMSNTLKWSKE